MRRPLGIPSWKRLQANAVTAGVYLGLGYSLQKIWAMHQTHNTTATKSCTAAWRI